MSIFQKIIYRSFIGAIIIVIALLWFKNSGIQSQIIVSDSGLSQLELDETFRPITFGNNDLFALQSSLHQMTLIVWSSKEEANNRYYESKNESVQCVQKRWNNERDYICIYAKNRGLESYMMQIFESISDVP